ncbi:glycosyltransferase family 2 protein [Saccharicrinis sp. FJH54]|uniref:glycosyltransferase family 2 protein n=1 Tax=Saccharicrinis sp. FJH54 TaxID=3344665 RepID=UPI0035D43757
MKQNISAIILTYNEEIHIERAIRSIKLIAREVFVIDSYSTDNTIYIAKSLGAKVYQNPFLNQAIQFNWALDNLPINNEWIFRLDADEYLSEELIDEINSKLYPLPEDVNGIIMPLRRIFLEKEIKRGTGRIELMRLFKYKKGRSEVRNMDEHIVLSEGKSVKFKHPFADHNLNSLGWWTQKHNGYAIREAIDLLDLELNLLGNKKAIGELSEQAQAKRNKKLKYAKQPLFWRAFAYFIYRYILKLGFLEGKEGFLWHFLQGWWYRTLVDAKLFEIKKVCGTDQIKIKKYLKKKYNIQLD